MGRAPMGRALQAAPLWAGPLWAGQLWAGPLWAGALWAGPLLFVLQLYVIALMLSKRFYLCDALFAAATVEGGLMSTKENELTNMRLPKEDCAVGMPGNGGLAVLHVCPR